MTSPLPSPLLPSRGWRPLILACLTSCGSGSLITVKLVPASSAEVNDGQTPTQVVATVMSSGAPVDDGTQVTFTVDASTGASFSPIVGGVTNAQTLTVSTSAGKATAQLFDLAVEKVAVTITAQINPPSGTTYNVNGSITVQFGGACPDSFITAPVKSFSSGVPANLTFSCTSDYMGGIFAFDLAISQLFTGNTQTCTALVSDASGQAIQGAAVQFLAEAGAFETDVQASGQHPTVLTDATGAATVSYHVSAPYPVDVPPDGRDGLLAVSAGGHSTVPRAWTDSVGHTYNPRDGWVTLIAAVAGVPSGPISDPFVDSNDNGMWDLGEPYIDPSCSTSFNPTQVPDQNGLVRLWTSKTIVWTDGVWNRTDCSAKDCLGSGFLGDNPSGCSKDIKAGQSGCMVDFRFVDKNLNLLATFATGGSQMQFSPVSGSLRLTPSQEPIDPGLMTKSLTQIPDFTTNAIDTAAPPVGTMSCGISASGTFIFGDMTNNANAKLQLPLSQTFSFVALGSCDVSQ